MSFEKDIEEIKGHVNDLHTSVGQLREDFREAKTDIRWLKWFVGLIIGALLFSPLIAKFWAMLGV